MGKREEQLQKRAEILASAQSILDAAEKAGRGLTDAEKARHDRLLAEVRSINAMLEANAAVEREAAVTIPASQTTATAVAAGTMAATSGDPASPRPVRPLGAQSPEEIRYNGFAFSTLHSGSSFASGGVLIPEHVSQALWPQLEAESVVLRAGSTIMNLPNGAMLPGVNDRPRASWVNPDGEIPQSAIEFKGSKVDLKKLAALYPVANDLIRDAGARVSAWLLDQQAKAMGLSLDVALIEGSGTEFEPLGVKNRQGIQSVALGANGAAVEDLDPFIEAIGALNGVNAKPNAWIMPSDVWTALMLLRETDTSLKPLLGESWNAATMGIERKLLGLPVFVSSELSTTESEGSSGAVCGSVYLAEWRQVLVIHDGMLITEVNSSRLFNQDKSEIRSILRADVLTPNPEAIYRLRGVIVGS